jgi:hypothetical protein
MENISPSPTSPITPLTPGDKKNSPDDTPRKTGKPHPVAHKAPAPPEISERDDKHELDERA